MYRLGLLITGGILLLIVILAILVILVVIVVIIIVVVGTCPWLFGRLLSRCFRPAGGQRQGQQEES